jgi:hypothetical protein
VTEDLLHQLRQATAARLGALYERHNREADQVVEDFEHRLKELGLDEVQVALETLAMIREATPVSTEYDMTGLPVDDGDAGES